MANVAYAESSSSIGFDFSNYARNQFMGERLHGLPKGESSFPLYRILGIYLMYLS